MLSELIKVRTSRPKIVLAASYFNMKHRDLTKNYHKMFELVEYFLRLVQILDFPFRTIRKPLGLLRKQRKINVYYIRMIGIPTVTTYLTKMYLEEFFFSFFDPTPSFSGIRCPPRNESDILCCTNVFQMLLIVFICKFLYYRNLKSRNAT